LRGESIKRKVILHGPSTLTVSLPSKWVKAHNIRKGDELNVDEVGNLLNVYTGDEHLLTKRIKVDFSELDNQSVRIILSVLHKSGYDEIEVAFKDPSILSILQERINSRLIGFEIIEQRGNMCIIKNVSGDHVSEMNALMRRAFLVTLSMANSSLEALRAGERDKLKEILVLEETNNKLVNYCQRLILKKPYSDDKAFYNYLVSWLVEKICDDYRDLVKQFLSEPKLQLTPALFSVYEETNDLFKSYYEIFYNFSYADFRKIQNTIRLLRSSFEKANLNKGECLLSSHLLGIVNKIHDGLGSVVGAHH
jgi:phosphate uptake regulator